jgi:hypothetical protein
MKVAWPLILVMLGALLTSCVPRPLASPERVTAQLALADASLTLGEPLPVRIRLQNTSGHSIRIPDYVCYRSNLYPHGLNTTDQTGLVVDFHFEPTSGAPISEWAATIVEGVIVGEPRSYDRLSSNEVFTLRHDFNQHLDAALEGNRVLFEPLQPGEYRLSASIGLPGGTVKTDTLSFVLKEAV